MSVLEQIRAKRDEIYAIAREHKAEKLWVFGSCARGEERPDSDIDFIVEGSMGIMDQILLQDAVSNFLGLAVDVVPAKALTTSPCFAYNVRKDMVEL